MLFTKTAGLLRSAIVVKLNLFKAQVGALKIERRIGCYRNSEYYIIRHWLKVFSGYSIDSNTDWEVFSGFSIFTLCIRIY